MKSINVDDFLKSKDKDKKTRTTIYVKEDVLERARKILERNGKNLNEYIDYCLEQLVKK